MDPKTRVRNALSRQKTDRTPFSWGFCATAEMIKVIEQYYSQRNIDWQKLRESATDICGIGPQYIGPPPLDGNCFTGIWGIKLKNVSYGTGEYQEFTDFPLAGILDPSQLHDYPWPDAANYDYRSMRQSFLENQAESQKAVKYFGGNPFEIYCWMTGLEEALVNMLINPEIVRVALGYITDFFKKRLENVLENAGDLIDIVFFADDLGSQTSLLMSRECYREILAPYHKQLTNVVKQAAPHAYSMLHSDGAVFDILPDLIDAGVDIHEAVQTDAAGMEPERLKKTYGDTLCFHGGISVQQLLPTHNAKEVKKECHRLIDIFGQNGGYIAAPTHAIQMGTPPENIPAMLEAVLGEEEYRKLEAEASR